MKIILTTAYAISLLVPLTLLVIVFLRARSAKNAYEENKRKRKEIDDRFDSQKRVLEQSRNEIRGRMENNQQSPNWASLDKQSQQISQEIMTLEEARVKKYQEQNISYLPLGRLNDELEDVLDGRPMDSFYLASSEMLWLGLSMVVGHAASIVLIFA